LVYGGGSKGIMGVVSGAVLEGNGKATGIVPAAMLAAGGEGGGTVHDVHLNEPGREKVRLF
jgi:predicted Rossmann-fold nucleotide-binding protein